MGITYSVIGVMSGSSMDGVDLACCDFSIENQSWTYTIIAAQTFPYNEQWLARLSQLNQQDISFFPKTHMFYGRYLGRLINDFIKTNDLKPAFVSSHGHTIFHQPQKGFTAQIGDGAAIAAETGLPVVSDFRTMDMALGGQGAPLVPIGDMLLFGNENSCLNLGGIANISFQKNGRMHAFDICPCNMALNLIAARMGLPYDDGGTIAASADHDTSLLESLEKLPFYELKGARSLGREWFENEFLPLIKPSDSINDTVIMATLTRHIANRITSVLRENAIDQIFITGGGAFNITLINLLKEHVKVKVPDDMAVNFKEALIFAFLGVLRVRNEVNVLCNVTGSKHDHVAGALYGDFSSLYQYK